MMQIPNAFRLLRPIRLLALCCIPVVASITGCSSNRVDPQHDSEALETPAFLASPAMALMTNTDGFSARVEIQTPSSSGIKTTTGQLFGNGARLLFLPSSKGKRAADTTSFAWDVAQSKGYVFNEALQGYAPFSKSAHITSVDLNDVAAVFNDLGGHRCRRGEATIITSEGPEQFTVWRATDLKNFPVQIKAGSGRYVLTFSKIAFEPVGRSVFIPPDGFTKHASPEAMLGALLEREVAAKKKVYDIDDQDDRNIPDPSQNRTRMYQ